MYVGAAKVVAHSMLGAFGDTNDFVTITPQGSGAGPHWDVEFDAPDVRFVGDLIGEAARTLCVDRRRIFVTGFSNEAALSSTIAFLSSRIGYQRLLLSPASSTRKAASRLDPYPSSRSTEPPTTTSRSTVGSDPTGRPRPHLTAPAALLPKRRAAEQWCAAWPQARGRGLGAPERLRRQDL